MKKAIFFASIFLIAILLLDMISLNDENDEITVYISISCESINDNYSLLDESLKGTEYVPADGVILPKTEVTIKEGESVLDLTKKVTKDMEIQLEYSQSPNDSYVQGINYLYEFSCGDLSGWMYSVNGDFANMGCNSYSLKGGDVVKWQYTCDLGNDLKEVTE